MRCVVALCSRSKVDDLAHEFMSRGVCIWCLKDSADTDREHIFPAALGCPDDLTLPGSVVCKRCNNGLAHLDQVVADDFDFLLVMNGARRKRGRPSEVASRGNVYATSAQTCPIIFFNLDAVEHAEFGEQRIGPYRGRTRDIRAQLQVEANGTATVKFEVALGQNKKFVRGLYKIALNSIARFHGPDVARAEHFDWIRQYVRHGGPQRRVIVTAAPDDQLRFAAFTPWPNCEGDCVMEIRMGVVSFLLDLSRNESVLASFAEEAKRRFGESGYSIVPTHA
jgi:HNH endonuclease